MLTRSATPSASAPPQPPSPITVAMIGVSRRLISKRLRAMPSLCPRSSAPRHLHALKRRQAPIDIGPQLDELLPKRRDLVGDVQRLLARQLLQLVDLPFQLVDRLLELHGRSRHPGQLPRTRRTRSSPSRARKSVSAACVAASLSERDRSRDRAPLPSLHPRSTRGAPECDVACASITARTSAIASGDNDSPAANSIDTDT